VLLDLTIQKHFLLLFLEQEGGLADGVRVIFLVVPHLAVRLAVEDQLRECFRLLENAQNVLVEIVERRARVYKCAILETVLLKSLLVSFSNLERLDALLIFQL
jgi:hypothetical protein